MKRYTSFLSTVLLIANILLHAQQNHIIIRHATSYDLDTVIALDTAISHEYFRPLLLEHYPEFQEKKDELEKILASDLVLFNDCIAMKDHHHLFVASHENNLVGYIACHLHDTIAFIDFLLIDDGYRGMGIGKKLIATCLEAFSQAETCMLVVLDKNTAARTAYEKMGFTLMHNKPLFIQQKYPESRYICYEMLLHTK